MSQAKKVLVMLGGAQFGESGHSAAVNGPILKEFMEASGRYEVTLTEDRDMFRADSVNQFDLVIVYTTGGELTPEQEEGLAGLVKGGKGFVGIHSAADSFKANEPYMKMIGARFRTHPPFQTHDITLLDDAHPVTVRTESFAMDEELYLIDLQVDREEIHVLAQVTFQGTPMPVLYTKGYGEGRVVYCSLGHQRNAFENGTFRKWILHGADWATRTSDNRRDEVTCGVIGYGPAFGMGKIHGEMITGTPGLTFTCICDRDERALVEAGKDWPKTTMFKDHRRMIHSGRVEVVVIVTPHNTHAQLAVEALEAGCHVVMEKPMAVTSAECTSMIDAAKAHDRMLTVFHNRRLDDDFLTIKDFVARDLIGDVVYVEGNAAGRGRPRTWWRTSKEISGGRMHDWGAHFIDWMLQLVPQKVTSVFGCSHKCAWHHVTNQDDATAIFRFENGCVARFYSSAIDPTPHPRWRIIGTKGAIVVEGQGYTLYTDLGKTTGEFPKWFPDFTWKYFYWNLADHLVADDPLMVTAEEARRAISVIEAAERSADEAREVAPAFE